MSDFQQLKLRILDLVGLSKDAVHMHLGLLVFVAILVIARGRKALWLAWLGAAAVALGIEILDLRDDRAHFGRFRWAGSLHDVLNTLLWPTILALLARFWWREGGNS
jgi:hypothetical protein